MPVWDSELSLAVAVAYEVLANGQRPRREYWDRDTWPDGGLADDKFWRAVNRGLETALGNIPLPQNACHLKTVVNGPQGPQAEAGVHQELTHEAITQTALRVWLVFELLPIAKKAMNRLRYFLERSVEMFPNIEKDDWWGYARLMVVTLIEGKCRCGQANCSRQHVLPQWDPCERSLESFIFRAVIGPAGLRAISVSQGAMYLILRDDHDLLRVKVGFKCCAKDSKIYEGSACPYCRQPEDPATTPVFARDWLVIGAVYEEGPRWWACGKGRRAHYYRQQHCLERQVDNPEIYPAPAYHLECSDKHDCCPLLSCQNYGQRHGLRGSTLWWRAQFSGEKTPSFVSKSPLVQSLAEAARGVLSGLDGWKLVWSFWLAREAPESSSPGEEWKAVLSGGAELSEIQLVAFSENLVIGKEEGSLPISKALKDLSAHAAEIADALAVGGGLEFPRTAKEIKAFEGRELRPQMKQKVVDALQNRGISEEEALEWLRGDSKYPEGYDDDEE